MIICHFAIFMQGRAQLGEKRGFIYAWAEFYLQSIVGWNCRWADHYLWAVICRSRGGLLVNENEENFASNDNNLQWTFTILLVVSFISFTFWYLGCHQYCVGFKDSGNIWFWRWEQSEYKPLLDDHPWGSEKPHALIHIMYMNRTTQRFSYDLEMKTREQKRNNKRTEIQQFDWFIERIQTHLAFGWLSERSAEKTSCPKNFLEIVLTSYCNRIGQSNNAFSILGFSLAGKRRVYVWFFSSIGW